MNVKQPDDLQERRLAALRKAMRESEDVTFVIILLHLYSEQILEELITLCLERPSNLLQNGRLSYKQKLLLVESFAKIDPKVLRFLNVLNKLRNKAAHSLEFKPNEESIRELVGTTGLDLSRFGTDIAFSELLPFGIHLVLGRLGAMTDAVRAEKDGSIHSWPARTKAETSADNASPA